MAQPSPEDLPDLSTLPAGTPPSPLPAGWYGPFTGESLHTTTVALFAVLGPIAVLFVALRFYAAWRARGSDKAGIRIADWCALGALVLTLVQESIIMTLGQYKRHQYDVSVAAFLDPIFYKRVYAQYVVAWPAITLSKFAILLLYLRIFSINKTMRWAVYGGLVLTCIAYLPNIAVSSYFCAAHVGEQWGASVGIRCGDTGALKWLVASATLSLVLDLYILILPVPQVLGLKMDRRKRWGLLAVFLTASFACICALLTLIYRVRLAGSDDPLWLNAQLWVTNLTENFIAIIVSSAPGVSAWITNILVPSSFYSKTSASYNSLFRSNKSRLSTRGSVPSANDHSYNMDNRSGSDNSSTRSFNRAGNGITVKQTYSVSHTAVV